MCCIEAVLYTYYAKLYSPSLCGYTVAMYTHSHAVHIVLAKTTIMCSMKTALLQKNCKGGLIGRGSELFGSYISLQKI